MSTPRFLPFLLLLLSLRAAAQLPEIALEKGLTITESCRIVPMEYSLDDSWGPSFRPPVRLSSIEGVIAIEGHDITVDFQNATLRGSLDKLWPSEYLSLGIRVKGSNIRIVNLRVRGFKVGLLADSVRNLTLENCDFSYNFRQRLRSSPEREDFADWLSHHDNDRDQWLRYGAGAYLRHCQSPTVKNCRATGCQNALMMHGCTDGTVMNNTFQFNSGLGIGLYRSSRNRLMHNKLDWNVRGYSHKKYQRGQDSAGILLYEQSSENVIAYNSATHCGDGLFLWAGQTTMDTGKGGCNGNIIFGNDFSHAPTNGVEVTFSQNRVQGNLIRECTYGIWGGYSYGSVFMGNLIADCQTAIAIEHGQDNTIRQNLFSGDSTGISLWARASQPSDWGYAKSRDVRSRNCLIDRNVFLDTRKPLTISNSQNIAINGENLFANFETLLKAPKPNDSLRFLRNDLYAPAAQISKTWAAPELASQRSLNFSHPDEEPANPYAPLEIPFRELKEPDSLPGGINAGLPKDALRGREWIVMDEWGPYNFRYPKAWLISADTLLGDSVPTHTLRLYFPPGAWRLVKKEGIAWVSDSVGSKPGALLKFRPTAVGARAHRLEFEFRGRTDWPDALGNTVEAGHAHRFDYQYFKKKMDWEIAYYNYDNATDPATNEQAFELLKNRQPDATAKTDDLYFAWWDSPAATILPDSFATRATATFEVAPGVYKLELTSDDGARLYLDGERVLNHWRAHEPETDESILRIGAGQHKIVVEHYDATGFSTLDFRLTPMPHEQ